MSKFTYDALKCNEKQIRLLTILPRERNALNTSPSNHGLVHCTTEVVSLNKPLKYTALSYVWGDPQDKKQVVLHGSVIDVTTNLENALRHLEQESESIILWADALCINQANIPERNQQVQLMKDIYETASEVFVWLGPENNDNEEILNFLEKLGHEALKIDIFRPSTSDMHNIFSPNTREDLCKIKRDLDGMLDKYTFKIPWLDLNRFFSHPWFSRVWVVQELAVSSDGAAIMCCGQNRVPFRHISAGLLFLSFFRIRAPMGLTIQDYLDPRKSQFWADMNCFISSRPNRMLSFRRQYQQEKGRPRETLFQMLSRTHAIYTVNDTIQATDPRDRIYAFLGLVKEDPAFKIEPNYKKSAAEVFTEAAEAMLRCGDFDLLALNQVPKTQFELPSWVPDWTSYIQKPWGSFKRDNCYEACGHQPPLVTFRSLSGAPMVLNIKGCIVDTITKVGVEWLPTLDNWQDGTRFSAQSAYFKSIENLCAESDDLDCDIYKDPSQRLEAFWRIPCGNKGRKGVTPSRPTASGAELYQGYMCMRAGKPVEECTDDERRNASNYLIAISDEFKRKPFISTLGYVGLAPSHSKPDDIICILYGCVVPFILRRSDLGYELIGGAYVHGIMDGEFLESAYESELFTIR